MNPPPDNPRQGNGRLPSAVAQQIDENLRLLYAQHLEEDLPAPLQELVARLREQGARTQGARE